MEKGVRICKVCGKEYPYCKTFRSSDIFRYQDVACSPECGEKYFKKILESRMEKIPEDTEPVKEVPKKKSRKAKKAPVDIQEEPPVEESSDIAEDKPEDDTEEI